VSAAAAARERRGLASLVVGWLFVIVTDRPCTMTSGTPILPRIMSDTGRAYFVAHGSPLRHGSHLLSSNRGNDDRFPHATANSAPTGLPVRPHRNVRGLRLNADAAVAAPGERQDSA
jgi:hypothetical protein